MAAAAAAVAAVAAAVVVALILIVFLTFVVKGRTCSLLCRSAYYIYIYQ